MKRLLVLLLLVAPVHAEGPLFRHKDGKVDQEFENVYQDMRSISSLPSRTKSQLLSNTPDRVGRMYYCSDCATDGVVVSTAVTPGGVGRISARSTVIN